MVSEPKKKNQVPMVLGCLAMLMGFLFLGYYANVEAELSLSDAMELSLEELEGEEGVQGVMRVYSEDFRVVDTLFGTMFHFEMVTITHLQITPANGSIYIEHTLRPERDVIVTERDPDTHVLLGDLEGAGSLCIEPFTWKESYGEIEEILPEIENGETWFLSNQYTMDVEMLTDMTPHLELHRKQGIDEVAFISDYDTYDLHTMASFPDEPTEAALVCAEGYYGEDD